MAKHKQDDINPTEFYADPVEPSGPSTDGPASWLHPYRSCSPKDRELYILQSLLAGGAFPIPSEEAPPRTAERLLAIVEEIVKQSQAKGWIAPDPAPVV